MRAVLLCYLAVGAVFAAGNYLSVRAAGRSMQMPHFAIGLMLAVWLWLPACLLALSEKGRAWIVKTIEGEKEWTCGECGAHDFENHRRGCKNDPTQDEGSGD